MSEPPSECRRLCATPGRPGRSPSFWPRFFVSSSNAVTARRRPKSSAKVPESRRREKTAAS
eukprot:1850889-Pyramimonas_sp.AAC.1